MTPRAEKEARLCSRCGHALTGDELSSNCPRCLAELLLSDESVATTIESALPPGIRRLGDYELMAEVARGGMGVVFRARQVSLNRIVAVKILRDAWLATPIQVKRFRAEAANAARLKHPNIVAVHEVGEQEGQHFFAMDLIQGMNLAEVTRQGPVSPRRAAELVSKVAEAVQHAHEQGVLHRDIKPSNVILDSQGEPHVTDFGLARPLDDESSLTLTGQVLGTPGYIAPEQAKGGGAVGPAADVYGLGALLFHLLTGRAPFVSASAAETLTQVLQQEPLSPKFLNPIVPADLVAVCLKCLAKSPGQRYASPRELAADLKRFLNEQPTRARPTSLPERTLRWAKRKPALAGLVLVGIIGMVGVFIEWHRAESESLKLQFSNYAADMNLAARALEDSNFGRTRELLNKHQTRAGAADFRGWEWRYLSWCVRSDEARFLGRHSNSVSSVVFSPDGGLLASGGLDGELRFWKPGSWELAGRWRLPAGVRTIAFSPDSKILVTGTLNNELSAWEVATQQRLFSKPWEFGQFAGAVKFALDSKEIVAASNDGKVAIFDLHTGESRAEFQATHDPIHAIALSPDGKRLWVGSECLTAVKESTLAAWDIPSRKKLWSKTPHPYYVNDVQCSPDGQLLASCGVDRVVRLWDATNGNPIGELEGHLFYVNSLCFSSDGRWLATGGTDQSVILWDAVKRSMAARFQGSSDEIQSLAYSTDLSSLVSGGKDGSVRVWPATPPPTNTLFVALPQGMFDGKISRYGKYLSVSYPDGIQIWDSTSGKMVNRRKDVLGALLSRDENLAVTFHRGGEQAVCSLPELKVLKPLPAVPGDERTGAAFSSDSRRVATGHKSGAITFWDWNSGKLLGHCHPHAMRQFMRFSPDDKLFATGCADGTIQLWRTADASLLATFAAHDNQIRGLSFSPDGTQLASASLDASARVWDVKTQKLRQVFRGHRIGLVSAIFSQDGRRLFTSGYDGEIRVWDLNSGQSLLTLRGHPMETHIALRSDDTLISASIDGIRYWHAPLPPPEPAVAPQR